MSLNQDSMVLISGRIQKKSGIAFHHNSQRFKNTSIENCVKRRCEALGLNSVTKYHRFLRSLPENHAEWDLLIEEMEIGRTRFFRESSQLNVFAEVLRSARAASRRPFRVWSAACSTGEEPLTLAMLAEHHLGGRRAYDITASDINPRLIRFAEFGLFRRSKIIRQIPKEFRSYFASPAAGEHKCMRLLSPVMEKMTFVKCNLLSDRYPSRSFDVIFCRNVFFYFRPEDVEKTLDRLYAVANPGGYLFVSRRDHVTGLRTQWKKAAVGLYRKI